MSQFITDIEKIRSQAKKSLDDGAVTDANESKVKSVIALLDAALATEWICVLRYSQHSVTATGIYAETIAEHFAEHAQEELEHAHWLAKRIQQLGGVPHLDPAHLVNSAHSYYAECNSLLDMIKENLIAERIAIISYTEMIRSVGESDPTSRRLFEKILEVEEEHADDLASLLDSANPTMPLH